MSIFLVVFDSKATSLGEHIFPDSEKYIGHNYVYDREEVEYKESQRENARIGRSVRRNVDVYKRAIVDKKTFSKIKNND